VAAQIYPDSLNNLSNSPRPGFELGGFDMDFNMGQDIGTVCEPGSYSFRCLSLSVWQDFGAVVEDDPGGEKRKSSEVSPMGQQSTSLSFMW
jgi:hypothetical protein